MNDAMSVRFLQKLIEQMKEVEFCDGKAQYKYQPPVPVNFSNPVSAHVRANDLTHLYEVLYDVASSL